ncbi:MAG: hypothetical protein KGJ32_00810 [Xanthomonadaceae bacterium]|nr:hypothetical protein [Xanthomonadaceae bacterium]
MSNVIDFLERVGQDARLRHASQDVVQLALADAQIDPELRVAIHAKDQRRLEALLGKSTLCCAFMAPETEDEGEGMSPAMLGAIFCGDQPKLQALLGLDHFCCMFFADDGDEEESREKAEFCVAGV